jgi:hypothetical protein
MVMVVAVLRTIMVELLDNIVHAAAPVVLFWFCGKPANF